MPWKPTTLRHRDVVLMEDVNQAGPESGSLHCHQGQPKRDPREKHVFSEAYDGRAAVPERRQEVPRIREEVDREDATDEEGNREQEHCETDDPLVRRGPFA